MCESILEADFKGFIAAWSLCLEDLWKFHYFLQRLGRGGYGELNSEVESLKHTRQSSLFSFQRVKRSAQLRI